MLRKNLSHGLQFQANYVRSSSYDDSQGILADGSGQTTDSLYTQRYDWGPSPYNIPNNFRANLIYNLPSLYPNSLAGKFIGGWWVGSIIAAQSGPPFSPGLSYNPSLSGNSDRASFVTSANLATAQSFNPKAVVYDPNTVIIGSPNQWFNPNMFTTDPSGYHGTVPRNLLEGPALYNWDFSVNKNTPIRKIGEAGMLQFRAEIFNLLNHPNLGSASSTVASAGGINSTAGIITSLAAGTTARQVQLALKLIF